MLNSYDVAFITAFLAGLMSFCFWLALKFKWLASLEKRIVKQAPEIGKKTWELIKDDIPDIKEEFKKELPAMITAFKAELPSMESMIETFKKEIPDFKTDVIPMIKEEFENSNIIEDAINGLMVKIDEKDPVTLGLMAKIFGMGTSVVLSMVMEDPKTKEKVNGWMISKGETIFKTFEGKMEKLAATYGITPGGGGQPGAPGQAGMPGMNPEMQKTMGKAMRMYQIWNEGKV